LEFNIWSSNKREWRQQKEEGMKTSKIIENKFSWVSRMEVSY
jgi:hypothetical protein